MTDFIKRHSLRIYFALTFIISWGAVLILAGPDGIPVAEDQAVVLGLALLLGPSVAGILLTGLTSGRDGFRKLLSHLLRWRVNARWYAIALLTFPLSALLVILVLSLFAPGFAPPIAISEDRSALVWMGVVAGLMVGFFEELGWTAFAIPRMRARSSVFTTGLIVGLLWGAWHFIMFWESDSFSGAFPLLLLLVRLFSWLPAYRILMVWVFDRTESLLIVMLMHGSQVFNLVILDPVLTGWGLFVFILTRVAVLWAIVAVVAVAHRGHLETGRVHRAR